MAPHSSTLAWKIPWVEEPGRLQSMGSLRVGHDWATSLSLFTFMHWRRKWQPTPVFLPGESQGRGSLVGCRLWGRTELDMTEATQQLQHDPSKVGWGPFLPSFLFFFFKSIFLIFKWCWRVSRKKKFPLFFQVLLAGLRIKLACYRLAGENQTQFNAYMRETQENWVTHQNGWKLYLKYHLQTKKKRECWGYWFGTSKRRKAVDKEIEMQMLGKQMCWAIRDNGTQRNFNKQTLLDSFLFINLVHAIVIYGNSSLPGTSSLSTFI